MTVEETLNLIESEMGVRIDALTDDTIPDAFTALGLAFVREREARLKAESRVSELEAPF